MSTCTIDRIIEKVNKLPRLPDTALRLVNVINDPDSSMQTVVDTIRYDHTVTAEALRLCNSAYYGLARQVDSIDDAVCLLGTSKVMQLVMSVYVQDTLSQPQAGYGLAKGDLWDHSIMVALACRLLSEQMAPAQQGLLFTTGLLHDIGKLVLSEHVALAYSEIIRRVTEEGASFLEAEQDILGFSHPQVGARLAEAWSLPESITRCICYHHDPNHFEEPDLALDIVYLADAICLTIGVGNGTADGLAYRAYPDVINRRGLTRVDLELIGADVIVELKSIRDMFAANK
ncbi:MAG: HDOD domain-containing protein [Planctomycetota bacterium]